MNQKNASSTLVEFSRRKFMVSATVASAGLLFVPRAYTSHVQPMPSFGKFFKRFAKGLAKIGLGLAGVDSKAFFDNTEVLVKKEIEARLQEVYQKGYKYMDQFYPPQAGSQVQTAWTPRSLVAPTTPDEQLNWNNFALSFFNATHPVPSVYGTTMSTPTAWIYSDLADALDKFGMGMTERGEHTIPTAPKQLAYYDPTQGERHYTQRGVVTSTYVAGQDNKSGFVIVEVLRKKGKSDLTEPIRLDGQKASIEFEYNPQIQLDSE